MAKKVAAPAAGSSSLITVDFTGVETGKGKVRVPEADYGVKLVELKRKTGEESQKAYLDCQFEITKGDKRGMKKKIRHSFSLQKQSLWNFRSFLEAAGKQVPTKAVKIDLKKLIGLSCAATMIDDEYEGRKYSIISAFFPLADLGNTSAKGDTLDEETTEETEETEETEDKVEEAEEAEETAEEEEELFN